MTASVERKGPIVDDWDLPKLRKEIGNASDKIIDQTTDVAKPVFKQLVEMAIDQAVDMIGNQAKAYAVFIPAPLAKVIIDKPLDISKKKSKEYAGPKIDQCTNGCKKKTKESVQKGIEKGFGPLDSKSAEDNSLDKADFEEESDEYFDANESFTEESSLKTSKDGSKNSCNKSKNGSKQVASYFFTRLFKKNESK